jgi:DNA-binding NarL/FixJ family response regulator
MDQKDTGVEPERREPGRIAIVEDHQLLSAALGAALRADGYSVLVPELNDMGEVADILTSQPPAVALLDLDLGSFGNGEDLIPVLARAGTRALVMSGTNDESVIGRCLEAGAWGWVPKSAPFDVLLGAILQGLAGQSVQDPAERDRLVRAWRERRTTDAERLAPFERLSRREGAVLSMLQDGKSVERIAAESYVSAATVRTQVRAILTKLEVNSQLEAVAKAARAGWQTQQ